MECLIDLGIIIGDWVGMDFIVDEVDRFGVW